MTASWFSTSPYTERKQYDWEEASEIVAIQPSEQQK